LKLKCTKHLAGQHSQLAHGRRGRGTATLGHDKFNGLMNQALGPDVSVSSSGVLEGDDFFVSAAVSEVRKNASLAVGELVKGNDEDFKELAEQIGAFGDTGLPRKADIALNLISQWNSNSGKSFVIAALQKRIREKFGLKDAREVELDEGRAKVRDEILEKAGGELDLFVDAIYQHTQTQLKEAGISEITLYRGMALHQEKGTYETNVNLQPASSFSTSFAMAANFANARSRRTDKQPAITSTTVEAENVFSLPTSGVGSVLEFEVVVLGGTHAGRTKVGREQLGFDQGLQQETALEEFYKAVSGKLELNPDDEFAFWINDISSGRENMDETVFEKDYTRNLVATIKTSTASEYLQGSPDLLQEVVFDTMSGRVSMGFLAEFPQWMQDAIEELLDETFQQDFWAQVNETTLADIEQFIRQGLQDGWSIDRIAREMAPNLVEQGQYAIRRGKLIARTETTTALNSARSTGIDAVKEEVRGQVPIKKVWLSVLGTTTRDDHANLDGVPEDVDGMWELAGLRIRWPGDSVLPPEERCNCQCTLVSEFGLTDIEAQRLISEYQQRIAKMAWRGLQKNGSRKS
jgi:bifunctional DNA-binding transcriptional regulator/antitoxin component of YhaV-PrlF toxin-antitoxin module